MCVVVAIVLEATVGPCVAVGMAAAVAQVACRAPHMNFAARHITHWLPVSNAYMAVLFNIRPCSVQQDNVQS